MSAPAAQPQAQQPNLGWYNFITNISVWITMVLALINGIMLLSGANYDGKEKLVYDFFDGLKTLDVVFGLLSIAIAGLDILTRFRLKGFHRNAPVLTNIFYWSDSVFSIVYLVSASAVTGIDLFDFVTPNFIIAFVYSVVVAVCCLIYFSKIKHLFVNP